MKLNRKDFSNYTVGATDLVFLNSSRSVSVNEARGERTRAVPMDTPRYIGCRRCYTTRKRTHNLPETIKPDADYSV